MSEQRKLQRWRKVGGGSLRWNKRIIKQGQIFEAFEDELPAAFRKQIVPVPFSTRRGRHSIITIRQEDGEKEEGPSSFFKKEENLPIMEMLALFEGKKGIEIGGPSKLFKEKAAFPIYPVVQGLDGCNFSKETLWETGLTEGEGKYRFIGDRKGYQYICEATEIDNKVSWGTYDFLISSNCLEHIANPLKAMEAFKNVVRIGGIVLIIVPNKKATFDHRRPTITYHHLYLDYLNKIKEDDLTHLEEILKLHDLSKDLPAGNLGQFKSRSQRNYENRGLHHHVFHGNLLIDMFIAMNLQILYLDNIVSDWVIVGKR